MKKVIVFIVDLLSCVMMKIVFCSALSHEVLNSQHYKHSQSTEACVTMQSDSLYLNHYPEDCRSVTNVFSNNFLMLWNMLNNNMQISEVYWQNPVYYWFGHY